MDECIYQQLVNDKELQHLNLEEFQSVIGHFETYFGSALSSACGDSFYDVTLFIISFYSFLI